MPPRKRQLSPQDESDVVPPSKKAKLNVIPPPSTSIHSPDVVNEVASDSASTLSGEGAPLKEDSPNPIPSAAQPTSNIPTAGQAGDVDSSNLATPPEQNHSPSSESHTAPADEEPVLPGPLALRPKRMWKPDLIDQSLDVALKSYPRPNDYVEDEDVNWHSTNGNVAPVSFSNLVKLASVDLTFLHKLLAFVNHQTWKQKNRNVHNPLFASPTSFAFKSDYNHIAEGKIVAHFGLVCLVSTSSISQREGTISLAPLRQMWLALGRFLATLGGEVVIGFQTADGDLTMTRPPFTNGGGSPSKAGRDPAPDSAPSILVHDLTFRGSDSFDVSEFKTRYGDFKSNEVAFVTFTARKWDQDAKTLWLFTPVRFVSLSG